MDELLNTVYIAKKLYDMDKFWLVKDNFFNTLDHDSYINDMYSLIESLFEHYTLKYYEHTCMELHVFSDPVIVDFYKMAGEYGKLRNLSDDANPYIESARNQVQRQLNFSYCIDWRLMGHTEPKRPFHSRLGLFIYQDDWVEMGCVAYALIKIYEWFANACAELKDKLHENEVDEEAKAA